MDNIAGLVVDRGVTGQHIKPRTETGQSQFKGDRPYGDGPLFVSPGCEGLGLLTGHIATRAKGGTYFCLTGYAQEEGAELEHERGKRGVIVEFSRRSRKRMMDSLAVIDQGEAGLPSFMSLTYPDEVLPVEEGRVHRELNTFRRAMERRYGRRAICWRIEHKARKSGLHVGLMAPHVHLLIWKLEPSAEDREWLADTWCRIVGSGSRAHWCVTRHDKSWLMPDSARGMGAYVSKYCAKVELGERCGRSWGWWRHELIPVKLLSEEIPVDAFHQVRRVLRRYIAKHTKKGQEPRLYHRWQGLSVYMAEVVGARLVAWAWNVGWRVDCYV